MSVMILDIALLGWHFNDELRWKHASVRIEFSTRIEVGVDEIYRTAANVAITMDLSLFALMSVAFFGIDHKSLFIKFF